MLKVNCFKPLKFFQGQIIWITFGWGALGAETLCFSGVKICPWNTLGGEPRGTSWKCVSPCGRKRAKPAKFCIEDMVKFYFMHISKNKLFFSFNRCIFRCRFQIWNQNFSDGISFWIINKKKKNVKIVIIKQVMKYFSMPAYEISILYRYYIIFRCWIHIWKQFSSKYVYYIFGWFTIILNLFSIKKKIPSHEENVNHYNSHPH